MIIEEDNILENEPDIEAQDPNLDTEPEDNDEPTPEELEALGQREMAELRGWKSRDKWKGIPPDDFIDDPKVFNDRHLARNDRLQRENQTLRSEISGMKEAIQQTHKMQSETREGDVRRRKDDASRRMSEAVEIADTSAYTDAKRDYDALAASTSEPRQPDPAPQSYPQDNPDVDPNYMTWVAQNGWYNTDKVRTNHANTVASQEAAALGLTPQSGQAFYDVISQVIIRDFPPAYQPGRVTSSPGSIAGNPGRGRPKKESFDAIPRADRDQFKRTLVSKKIYENTKEGRANWAKSYWAEKDKS